MAHQLPVIAASTDPHLTNLVKQVPPRASDALTDALLELIGDTSERDRLSQQGSQFVQQFNWKTIAQSHLAIYQSVLSHA